jgi:hypothetical protein
MSELLALSLGLSALVFLGLIFWFVWTVFSRLGRIERKLQDLNAALDTDYASTAQTVDLRKFLKVKAGKGV